jgi:RNA polymerase sigma-70 factor (ECF subfamily)
MRSPEQKATSSSASARERLEVFSREEAGSLYTLFLRTSGDKEAARDLLQDTLLDAWKNLDRYDVALPFRAWIYRIGQNRLRNYLRRRGLEKQWFQKMPLSSRTRKPSPSGLLLAKERSEVLEDALLRLPPRQRVVILLRYQEELSCKDIGEIVDLTPNAVSIQLHHARQALKKLIGDRLVGNSP